LLIVLPERASLIRNKKCDLSIAFMSSKYKNPSSTKYKIFHKFTKHKNLSFTKYKNPSSTKYKNPSSTKYKKSFIYKI
jgi:hypothetical protein